MSEFWQKLVQATESLHPDKLKVMSENIGSLDSCRGFPSIVEDF